VPRRFAAAVLFAAAALGAGGCTWLAHAIWPCPVTVCPGTSRDTPDATVDLLIDAFRNRRIGDIYDSFHPEFRAEAGGFTKEEFSVAYEKFEADFKSDAANLATATRTWTKQPWRVGGRDLGVLETVRLTDAASGAEVVFALANRPRIRVVTHDRFVGVIEGPVDKSALVRLADGRLALPSDFPLTSIEGVQPETVQGLTGADIVRVEIADDWLVRLVPPEHAKNIRLVDQMNQVKENAQR
jgi:hypothetical protein